MTFTKASMTRVTLAGLGLVSAVALSACTATSDGHLDAAAGGSTSVAGGAAGSAQTHAKKSASAAAAASRTSNSPSVDPHAERVHIKLLEDDSNGAQTYGVGMPIVAYFSARIGQAKDFSAATRVTVNGKPNAGSWFFERSALIKGYPIEGHYRPAPTAGDSNAYWPAHAAISMDMKTAGVPAGAHTVFDNDLTLQMKTGAAHISTVDCAKEQMIVTSDGKFVHTMPTSCGAATTATYTGTKIVMQKGETDPSTGQLRPDGAVEMRGTPADPYDKIVPWSVRITQSGEYVHAASWNGGNIGRYSTSNGCTNLNTGAARWFYGFANVGDVVTYANTGGNQVPVWDGFGDWNVPSSTWHDGGLVRTS